MRSKIAIVWALCLITGVCEAFAFGGTGDVPASRLQTRYTGLTSPIFLTHAGDGTKRTFIVERSGIIKVVQPGSNVPTTFLNITALTNTSGERGLLGLAFHPDYETNRRFFVYYTMLDGDLRISEFEASPTDPNTALTAEKPIITIEHSQNNNHNGGTIAFGPDGYLYAAPGDGGGRDDPNNNAQNVNSLLGKVIRLDVDVQAGSTAPYEIPPDNPFAGQTAGADEIFAVGLRNPFRWSFDRESGQLWAGDVGQDNWEEVNIITSGGNYGWRIMEGNVCTPTINSNCTPPAGHIPPVFVYSSQNTSSRCSITGGYVYRGSLGTLPYGAYLYGDYCTGEILMWNNGEQGPLFDIADFNLVSFGEDEDGELYVIYALQGIIRKIVPRKANADFGGNFRTDLTVFRPSTNTYYILDHDTGNVRLQGHFLASAVPNWTPVPEDYDGDGLTEVGFYFNGDWRYQLSSDNSFRSANWGQPGDIPMPGDYDGDGQADFVVWRPVNGTWYFRNSRDGSISSLQWGEPGDMPISGDFDGDGRYDMAVWRPSNGRWYVVFSTNDSINVNQYGEPGDIPATGDFNGDGRNDLSVFRPSTGQWFQKLSGTNSFAVTGWGQDGDVPAVGDYDADGLDDIALWRPEGGTWFIIRSSGGILQVPGWGVPGDIPIPSLDAP